MRIMIKGGVWKNTEDEILKAAVMKYGLNQWARISSLLVRKSAKQCKARWYEWLDPNIKKTEWTREEDEKLLHLAKLMPTQWRTIAPIVGRTPAQCLERYEKLLDMAVSRDERYDPTDDPRRLRPGEIDPNPESKPARPDPVDMDEDEKEMLAEARARLANTRGKKAKRKSREKQMEEARRLASLQKRRELKAAGIEMRGKDKRSRGINYSNEVAFEKKPAQGFFDTGEEEARAKSISKEFRPVFLEELEGKKRKHIEEQQRKADAAKAKAKEERDAPGAVAKALEDSAIATVRRRGKMMLPPSQASMDDLEATVRNAEPGFADELVDGAGGEATMLLMGNYKQTPGAATALRTPRVGPSSGQDYIMQQAQNLARLQAQETPLAGGDNPDLHPTDFSGVTPRPAVAQTPNLLATPMHNGTVSAVGATPRRGGGSSTALAIAGISATPSGTPGRGAHGGLAGATPMRTPIRDELGLNEADELDAAVGGSKRAQRAREIMMRNELRAGLTQLPKPENEYQIVVPELPTDDGPQEDAMEEDAADIKARRLREEEARRVEEERKKSQALQRRLPRPLSLDLLPDTRPAADPSKLSYRERAQQELDGELTRLLQHDAAKYPIKAKDKSDKKNKRPRAPAVEVAPLEEFSLEELESARKLLRTEVDYVRDAMGHGRVGPADYLDAWSTARRDVLWLPGQGRYGRAASATAAERVDSARAEFEGVRKQMEVEATRAAKLEAKVKLVNGGLQAIDAKSRSEAESLCSSLQTASLELESFSALNERELLAVPERMEALQQLVAAQRAREAALQGQYKALVAEREEVRELLLLRGGGGGGGASAAVAVASR